MTSTDLTSLTGGAADDADHLARAGAGATSREIAQQPRLWRQCATDSAVRADQVARFLDPLLADPDLRVVLTGAGTSAFVGEVLAPSLGPALRRRVEAVATTDLVGAPWRWLPRDVPTLLVSFARSGDSPESVAAVDLADRSVDRLRHLVITCNPQGALARGSSGRDDTLVLTMPPEADDAGFAMTSSMTCMLLTGLLTLAPGLLPDGAVERLAAAGEDLLGRLDEEVPALAAAGYRRVVHLGSGSLTGLAHEAALKMLELTAGRVATWHESSLGFRHGPKAVLDDHTLVVVLASGDAYTARYDEDIVAEVSAAIGPENVVVVGGRGGGSGSTRRWPVAGLDGLDDAVRAPVLLLPAQRLALAYSLAHGLTPDNPFPSGTVNRVVAGVRIHPYDRRPESD